MAIDRAVLLPGQELMERTDREYNRVSDDEHPAEEEEIRRKETKRQAEGREEGQDPEQDEETREKIYQDPAEEVEAENA